LLIEVRQSAVFAEWFDTLRDRQARTAIGRRITRIVLGNLGDTKSVGGRVSELRFDLGPGYRVYFVRLGATVVILLCGGDKDDQTRDIAHAQAMASELE